MAESSLPAPVLKLIRESGQKVAASMAVVIVPALFAVLRKHQGEVLTEGLANEMALEFAGEMSRQMEASG